MPAIAVVVASHERPLRLRWLLNALAKQELDRAQWELVVCFDDAGEETAELLAGHELAGAGVLHAIRLPAQTGSAARQRNAGWRAARAPLVAFTDDDCRPPASWLAAALSAAREHPGAIVQGATRPDPAEAHLVAAPHARTQRVEPPVPWAQTCNVVYPRSVLEATGGFDEALTAGEDTELALRARAGGAAYVGAPGVLTYHCVEAGGLRAKLRSVPRWAGLAGVVRAHPVVRRELVLGLFWRRSHALAPLALLGLATACGVGARRRPGTRRVLERCRPPATRRPVLAAPSAPGNGRSPWRRVVGLALALPYALDAAPRYGSGPRARLRGVVELPGRAAVDLAEIAALARGSLRHRTVIL